MLFKFHFWIDHCKYRNIINFYILILWTATLMNSFIDSSSFLRECLRIFYMQVHVISEQILLLLPLWYESCSFLLSSLFFLLLILTSFLSWLSFLARTSSKILNRSGKRRHSWLVSYFQKKTFDLSSLSMMLTVDF